MHLVSLVSLFVFLASGLGKEYDFKVDLTSGKTVGAAKSISWRSPLRGSGPCAKHGTLKLSFGKPGTAGRKTKVRIDMWINKPRSWVFNVGDSSTNNGWSGDGATTSRDAEIQGYGSTFAIYANDYHPPNPAKQLYVGPYTTTKRFSVIIADGLVIWNNWGNEFNYMKNTNWLFALNGQPDREGRTPNYDIYFGMNQVVNGWGRRGSGMCHAAVTWL